MARDTDETIGLAAGSRGRHYGGADYDQPGYDEPGNGRAGYGDNGNGLAGYGDNGYSRAGYRDNGYSRAGYGDNGYSRASNDELGYEEPGNGRTGYDQSGNGRTGNGRTGYGEPGYEVPANGRTGYDQPDYSRSGYSGASYDEPGYGRSGYGRTGYDEPGYGRTGYDEPGYDEPGYDEPGYDGAGYGGPDYGGRPDRGGGGGDDDDGGRRDRPAGPVRQAWRRWRRVVLALVLAFLILAGWSVGRALTNPGGGSIAARLAEWCRGHYLTPLVTFGEWLTYQPPKVGGKPDIAMTGGPSAVPTHRPTKKVVIIPAPAPLKSLAGRNLAGEGVWRVLASVNGEPAIYGTYLRASSVYSSYVAGIAWMNQDLVKFQLRPGSEDPGPGPWKAQPWIPPGTRLGLLATFNGGFKISASGGGFYLNGYTVGALTRGIASLVYYRNGRVAIGVWGQSVHMTPAIVGVRQNLHLIVQNGRVPGSVNQNVETSWGATLGGSYYVWRSGIGITKGGQVVYVYGPALDVQELAQLLQRAGAVTAMQLDINPAWMSYMFYLPAGHPGNPVPHDLLTTQQQPANRYYFVNGRDFTAVYAR